MTDEKKKREDGEVADEQLQNVGGGKISVGEPADLAEREADEVSPRQPQINPRHADYDYAGSGGLIVTHRDKPGKDNALSDRRNVPFSH